MRNKGIRVLLSMCLLLCMLMNTTCVMAADEHLGEVVDGSVLTDDQEAENTVYSRLRGVFLSHGSGAISVNANGTINASGSTYCYVKCKEVKVTIAVERLVSGHWKTYKTIGTKTAYNNTSVSKTKTLDVPGGYYYRVKSAHVAVDYSGNVESLGGDTSGVWVDK